MAGWLVPRQAVSAETPRCTCASVEQQGVSERGSHNSRRRTEREHSLREAQPQAPEGLDCNQPTSHILPWGQMFMIYRLQFSRTPIINHIKRPKG